MNGEIVELYADRDLARLRQKIKGLNAAHLLLGAAALAACIGMAACVSTLNAARMEIAAVFVSTGAGWIILYGQLLSAQPCRRELRHALMLRRDEREAVTGIVTVTEEKVRIRSSITARRITVRNGEEIHRALVCESRAAALAEAGEATVYTVHGYAAAYERAGK